MNFSDACRDLLRLHREVHDLMFASMMPALSDEERKRIKRTEAKARTERKRLYKIVSGECRLRVDAWRAGRNYSVLPRRGRRHG
jgi:hypothetical protein